MDGRGDWNRNLFESLTSNRVSRNKYFTQFTDVWFKAVHKRYRIVISLKREAGRLGGLQGTRCWISEDDDPQGFDLLFHLQSPRLSYTRSVALQSYEWDWLVQQDEVRALLQSQPREALSG